MGILIFGLKVSIIGFGVVFLSLILITLIIQLQEEFFKKLEKKSVNKPEIVTTEPVPVVTTPEIKEDYQEELVAVIAAAICACGQQVIIKNIKRAYGNTGVPWATASRTDNMNLRKISVK